MDNAMLAAGHSVLPL